MEIVICKKNSRHSQNMRWHWWFTITLSSEKQRADAHTPWTWRIRCAASIPSYTRKTQTMEAWTPMPPSFPPTNNTAWILLNSEGSEKITFQFSIAVSAIYSISIFLFLIFFYSVSILACMSHGSFVSICILLSQVLDLLCVFPCLV